MPKRYPTLAEVMASPKRRKHPQYELSVRYGPSMEEIQTALSRRPPRKPLEFRLKQHDISISAIDPQYPDLLRMRLFGVSQSPAGLTQFGAEPQGRLIVTGLLIPYRELAPGPTSHSSEGFYAETAAIQVPGDITGISTWRPIKLYRVSLTRAEASIVQPVSKIAC